MSRNPWAALIAEPAKHPRTGKPLPPPWIRGPQVHRGPSITVDEWLRTLPPSESYQTPWDQQFAK